MLIFKFSDQATDTQDLSPEQVVFKLPPPSVSTGIQTDEIPPEKVYETVIEYREPPKPVMVDRQMFFGPQMSDKLNGPDLVCPMLLHIL